MTAFFLMLPAADDILLLSVMLMMLVIAAYAGRLSGHSRMQQAFVEPVVLTGAALTLCGLLIGFVFSLSLSGYSARGQAEVREAQSVASAWQYTMLLPAVTQQQLRPLLQQYLKEREHFFREDTASGGRGWLKMAEDNQRAQWTQLAPVAARFPTPVMASVLSVFGQVMASERQTRAVWKRQIPDAVWLVLIVFAASASFLVGHQHPERQSRLIYLLVLPFLTSLVLFMIAEIDLPGQGMIRVTPDELEHLSESLMADSTGVYHDLASPVHHVP